MKENYNKSICLRCITCGDMDFEYNEDRTWIKCNRCGREYPGGQDELVEFNQELINSEMENLKEEMKDDLRMELTTIFKNSFKGNKNIRFK